MEIKEWLMELSAAAGVSGLTGALDMAERLFAPFCPMVRESGSLIGKLQGASDYTILFDAHIDEIGMIVTGLEEGGFVRVSKAGGVDVRTLAAQPVTIWGREPVEGLFASTPPHLQTAGENKVPDIAQQLVVRAGRKGTYQQQNRQHQKYFSFHFSFPPFIKHLHTYILRCYYSINLCAAQRSRGENCHGEKIFFHRRSRGTGAHDQRNPPPL